MPDYTPQLRLLMQPLGFNSFRALSRAADVTDWQIELLRKGRVAQMRVEALTKLSQTLQQSVDELIALFSNRPATAPPNSTAPKLELQQLHQEYQRLQTQLDQQKIALQQEFQQASLRVLESWMIQFPTAAYAAQQRPELSATKLLPLMRPIEQLLESWGVEMLAPVGAELPYDPQYHDLLEGTVTVGEPVKVRYPGYRQGDKLLYRAKVSPVR